ncbi:MAG: hypothetical protein ACAH17_01710 [Candidatus Paceibacterota bacterium]
MKTLLKLLLVVLLLATLFYILNQDNTNKIPSNTATTTQAVLITDYVKQNISTLSYEKAQLGGTFYVTDIEAQDGRGTVAYEDGHMAYVADFAYTTDSTGSTTVTSFTIRK